MRRNRTGEPADDVHAVVAPLLGVAAGALVAARLGWPVPALVGLALAVGAGVQVARVVAAVLLRAMLRGARRRTAAESSRPPVAPPGRRRSPQPGSTTAPAAGSPPAATTPVATTPAATTPASPTPERPAGQPDTDGGQQGRPAA
ncbi:MAG: hypothetical protein EPO13_10450 [Actinomycetota bacterium]|nr:MAG: hypothetical protein EPO13_10450 [Actinomycetota bacterium]